MSPYPTILQALDYLERAKEFMGAFRALPSAIHRLGPNIFYSVTRSSWR